MKLKKLARCRCLVSDRGPLPVSETVGVDPPADDKQDKRGERGANKDLSRLVLDSLNGNSSTIDRRFTIERLHGW